MSGGLADSAAEPEAVGDARAFGLDAESIEKVRRWHRSTGGAGPRDGVWRGNAEIVELFLLVATQWRVVNVPAARGGLRAHAIGLDYAAVAAGLAGAGVRATPELWRGLMIMEAAARDALNGLERSDDAPPRAGHRG